MVLNFVKEIFELIRFYRIFLGLNFEFKMYVAIYDIRFNYLNFNIYLKTFRYNTFTYIIFYSIKKFTVISSFNITLYTYTYIYLHFFLDSLLY